VSQANLDYPCPGWAI